MPIKNTLFKSQFFFEAQCEISGSPGRHHDPVGNSFPHLSGSGSTLLRDREGIAQSGGATGDYGAGCTNHPLGFCVKNLLVPKVNSFPNILSSLGLSFHISPPHVTTARQVFLLG
jgi:hypothetical protein